MATKGNMKSGPCSLLADISEGQNKVRVEVQGNIGSGKTTFLNYFKDSKNVELVPEPVEMWRNVGGYNPLDLLYKDPQRWCSTFQSYVQLTALQLISKKQSLPVRMVERSLFGERLFRNLYYDSGDMHGLEYAVLSEWNKWISSTLLKEPDLIVYIRCDPEICAERIKKRDRTEENSIPMDYLESLHKLHEEWLMDKSPEHKDQAPVLVLDANQSLVDLSEEIKLRETEILCGHCY